MSFDWSKVEFKDEKRFLSNMYPCEIKFEINEKLKSLFPNVDFDGEVYGSSEHIYMAMKSKSKVWQKKIRDLDEPRKTKTLSRKALKTDILFETEDHFILRDDWDEIKVEVMRAILYLKFAQNKDLQDKLLSIDGYIEERNDWGDVFWGTDDGVGKNMLGICLMEVRAYFQDGFK